MKIHFDEENKVKGSRRLGTPRRALMDLQLFEANCQLKGNTWTERGLTTEGSSNLLGSINKAGGSVLILPQEKLDAARNAAK